MTKYCPCLCIVGIYVDKSVENPGIPAVLYTILALDFLIPTFIFIINECSGRIEAKRKKTGKFHSFINHKK